MRTFDLQLKNRSVGRKATRELRRSDLIPCEIYGAGENIHAYGVELDMVRGMHTPHVHLFNLDIEGKKVTAIVQAAQYHPVTDKILHVDFLQVTEDKAVKVNIPVELTGSSVGVIRGGKLRQTKRKLALKGKVADIPETVKIDISGLDVGQSIKVGQIEIPNIEKIDPAQTLVVAVAASRATAKKEEKEDKKKK